MASLSLFSRMILSKKSETFWDHALSIGDFGWHVFGNGDLDTSGLGDELQHCAPLSPF